MSKKQSDTSRGMEPPEMDDLKLINGIGPAVERRLHSVGIYTYAQLAALSSADIAAAVAGLSGLTAERITKQDWIGQARKLASESIAREAYEEVEAPAEPQAIIEDAYPAVPSVVSQVELAAPVTEEAESVPPVAPVPELTASAAEVSEPAPPIVTPPAPKEDQVTRPAVAIIEPVGMPRLSQIETVQAGTHTRQNSLPYGQQIDVHLTLDLSNVRVAGDMQFSYSASIYSKSLEGHPRQVVGETSGIIAPADKVPISVKGITLPKGTYRLKAVVILEPMTTEPAQRMGRVASKDSDLLLIF